MTGTVAQLVESLPSKNKDLTSTSNLYRRRRRRRRRGGKKRKGRKEKGKGEPHMGVRESQKNNI
jgi:hypothetical protein